MESNGNFGKTNTRFNECTGDSIVSKTSGQATFEKNFEAMQNGEAAIEAEKKQPVTMFPITFPIPQQLYKELEVLGEACNMSVQRVAQQIFLDAACSE